MSTTPNNSCLNEERRDVAPLIERLEESGIVNFFFSRMDYSERLDIFIQRATKSIQVVAVSFKLSSSHGDLYKVLQSKILSSDHFKIQISLLHPDSIAVEVLSKELAITKDDLRSQIIDSMSCLMAAYSTLPTEAQKRFVLLTHDSLPFGSGYLIDAEEDSGLIHVETKLHNSPRKESFGYQVKAPSLFYTQNYKSWMTLLDESIAFPAERERINK